MTSSSTTHAQADTATLERGSDHWLRNLAVCVFGSFTTIVGMTLLLPFLPLYVEQLGVKDHAAIVQWSGAAFGATVLSAALTAPLWGRLADRYGRKLMLIRASLGMAIAMSLIGMAGNVYQLVGTAPVGGAAGRLCLRIHGAGRHPDAQAPHGLGAGRAVVRHHGRQPGRAADRRRAATADRHTGDLPGLRRADFRGLPGDDFPDQGGAPAQAGDKTADKPTAGLAAVPGQATR